LPSQLLLKSLRGITKISSFTSPDFVEQKVGPQKLIFLQKRSLGKIVMLEIYKVGIKKAAMPGKRMTA
jgi:hypothetical protein